MAEKRLAMCSYCSPTHILKCHAQVENADVEGLTNIVNDPYACHLQQDFAGERLCREHECEPLGPC